ncbi:hypothetical protein V8C42DRAFT_312962 [Trichoderma barbatum]
MRPSIFWSFWWRGLLPEMQLSYSYSCVMPDRSVQPDHDCCLLPDDAQHGCGQSLCCFCSCKCFFTINSTATAS